MIKMAMSLKAKFQTESVILHKSGEELFFHPIILSWIDNDSLQAVLIPNQIGILLQGIEDERMNVHRAVKTIFLVLKYSSLK